MKLGGHLKPGSETYSTQNPVHQTIGDFAMDTESPREWVIKRVTAVQTPHSKKNWFPETKDVDGFIFFHFGKFERGVVFALTGKGLELRANKSPHLLDGTEYDRIVHLRNAECNRRYQETMKRAAEALGEEWKPTKNSMMAKDDHRLIVAQYVTISLPVLQKDATCIGPLEAKGLFERIKWRGFKNNLIMCLWIQGQLSVYS